MWAWLRRRLCWWDGKSMAGRQWHQSELSHTIKTLHIALQGSTVFSQKKYNVCDKLAKAAQWHSFWNASSFSMHGLIIVWFRFAVVFIFTVYFGSPSYPASSLGTGLSSLWLTQLQLRLVCFGGCHNAFVYAQLTKGCLQCFSSRKWRLFFQLLLRWRKNW